LNVIIFKDSWQAQLLLIMAENHYSKEIDKGKEKELPDHDKPFLEGEEIIIKTRLFNPYLVCKLCKGYYKEPTTIKECLHTFCKSCIYKSFQNEKKCPTCGVALGGKFSDSLRQDRIMQALINSIFPEMEMEEAMAEETFYKARGITPLKVYEPPKIKRRGGYSDPFEYKRHRTKKEPEPCKPIEISEKTISFILRLDSSQMDIDGIQNLPKPNLRTSSKVSITHLKKFLVQKLLLSSLSEVDILCRGDVMSSEYTLEYISKIKHIDISKDLELSYILKSYPTNQNNHQ